MYRLVRDGHVDPKRYVQIGLRGYWPGEREFAWQAEQGITSFFMHDVRDRGIRGGRRGGDRDRGRRAHVPLGRRRRARPGLRARHRHPRAGRHDERRPSVGVPRARRTAALVGMDVVEVLPTAIGSADITALVAERVVREALTGLARASAASQRGDQ